MKVIFTVWRQGKHYDYEIEMPQVPAVGETVSIPDVGLATVERVSWDISASGLNYASVMAG
jgi:hypothetical protein